MTRVRFIPSQEQRDEVRRLAATGAVDSDISAQLDIPEKKLRKLFRSELRKGAAAANQQALDKLHDFVSSGDNLSAIIFWLKAKCGWRDTGAAAGGGVTVVSPKLIIRPENSGTRA